MIDIKQIDIKQVPPEQSVRAAMRGQAIDLASDLDGARPPAWAELESRGYRLLAALDLPEAYLGYAMVSVSNAFWQPQFEGVPLRRRLLLLPRCLSNISACTAQCDSMGLHCQACGACEIGHLKAMAEALGYEVVAAEGTAPAVTRVLEGEADAILGVACLDSLEKSYSRIAELGIPHVAIPLITDGCVNTTADIDQIITAINSLSEPVERLPRSYLPLLRHTVKMFDKPTLTDLLPASVKWESGDDPIRATEAIALDWLAGHGKRLRPFITIAAYAAARHGSGVLGLDVDPSDLLPRSVMRIALAIEALHKASLVHDDIEDGDEFRYGRHTIHLDHGIAPAVNVGDYLIGLGYRLVSEVHQSLDPGCVADIVGHISSAHLELCRGQGAELLWRKHPINQLRPIDALSIYALKTAPALEVALYAGLRAAETDIDEGLLRQFSTYLGEGYQIINDLDDWDANPANHVVAGNDAVSSRPTILHAFALEAGGGDISEILRDKSSPAMVNRLREAYGNLGAFDKAGRLLNKLRERAEDLAETVQPEALRDLMGFLVGIILPRRRLF